MVKAKSVELLFNNLESVQINPDEFEEFYIRAAGETVNLTEEGIISETAASQVIFTLKKDREIRLVESIVEEEPDYIETLYGRIKKNDIYRIKVEYEDVTIQYEVEYDFDDEKGINNSQRTVEKDEKLRVWISNQEFE